MYVWIWRKLPGGVAGKLSGSLVLVAGMVLVLLFLVFPWAEPRLPFNNVNVDQPVRVNVDQPATVAPASSPAALGGLIIVAPRTVPRA